MEENQRVRLTRQLLRNSLVGLLETKSIHDISVREICLGAGINRTTFYRHYGGQYDLLKEIEDEAVSEIEACIPADETDSRERFARMLAYFDSHASLFLLLLNNTVDPEFPKRLMNLPRIKETLTASLAAGSRKGETEYLYDFIASGGQSVVKRWLARKRREPPESMAEFMERTIRKLF